MNTAIRWAVLVGIILSSGCAGLQPAVLEDGGPGTAGIRDDHNLPWTVPNPDDNVRKHRISKWQVCERPSTPGWNLHPFLPRIIIREDGGVDYVAPCWSA